MWSVPATHNYDARWLQRVKQGLAVVEKQEDIKITVESIQKCFRYVELEGLWTT